MGRTTITVSDSTFERLDEQRDGRVWDAFLNQLVDDTVTEPEGEVVEARITESQYLELYSKMEQLPNEILGELQG